MVDRSHPPTDDRLARLRDATVGVAPPPGFADAVRARLDEPARLVDEAASSSSRGGVVTLAAWRLGRWSLALAAAAALLAVASADLAERDLVDTAATSVDIGLSP